MTPKKRIKIIISIIAAAVAIAHLIFPTVNIDIITVVLLALAIIPWLEPLFKSVELPGGMKLEFHDLEKIEKEAKEIGLITAATETAPAVEDTNTSTHYFVKIAEENQQLALVSLRMEIEKTLMGIARKYNIEKGSYSIQRIIDALAVNKILSVQEVSVLKDIIYTLNQAAHNVEYDSRTADWIIENGSSLIDNLENKIAYRGVIFHGPEQEQEHWIDKSYRECNWVSNTEWIECITKHHGLWRAELERIYKSLMEQVNDIQRPLLVKSQETWEQQITSDGKFIQSFPNLLAQVGREGQILTYAHQLDKVRRRTLELEEILTRLVPNH